MNSGKLPLVLERFRTKETKIFISLGITNIAFWTQTEPATENGTLIYIVRHKSRAAARASWDTFKIDSEWVAFKAVSEKEGTFVSAHESTFIQLTDFSPKL